MPQYLVAIQHPDTFDPFQESPDIDVPRLRQHGRWRCVGQESLRACRTPVEIRAFLEMPSEQRQKIFATL